MAEPQAVSGAQQLRLGTRGSQLALWQAHSVASRLADAGLPPCEIVVIRTSGDRLPEAPLAEMGGKRLFVKEIEEALLRREIDLAVHSSKDMPATLPAGLAIGGVLPREDPRDALVLPKRVNGSAQAADLGACPPPIAAGRVASAMSDQPSSPELSANATIDAMIDTLGQTPAIGTGSVRRIAQLTRLFPGARFTHIRGNLDTRLRKLDEGGHDALVLAAAGLRRLGFESRISFSLPITACVPAPGQGIVAVEIRDDDPWVRRAVAQIDDRPAGAALAAERAVVEALGGSCQTPIGAVATPVAGSDVLELIAAVIALDGSRVVRASERGAFADAAAIGRRVGAQLIADGAHELLADGGGA